MRQLLLERYQAERALVEEATLPSVWKTMMLAAAIIVASLWDERLLAGFFFVFMLIERERVPRIQEVARQMLSHVVASGLSLIN